MTERTSASWLVYLLGALCAGAIAAAILIVGPASGSQASLTRTVTAQTGVVQSTVSGSGNLQAVSQLNLGFKTSGTVTHIYVTQGEQVVQGQLLAELNPQSAEVTLEQSKAALKSAEANLAKEEETNGEGSTGSGSGNSASASTASVRNETAPEAATYTVARTAAYPGGPPPTTTTPTTTTPTATTPTISTPSTTTPKTTSPTSTAPTSTSTTPTSTTPSRPKTTTTPASTSKKSTGESEGGQTSSSSSKSSISTATREANLASAKAAVESATLTVQSDEQAVEDTKLYAPQDGTIVSLSGQVGEVVSASGTTKASSASSSSSGSGSSATGASATRAGAGSSSSSGSSAAGSSGSSSSAFAVLSDLTAMQLVAPLSESEVGDVKVGQIATVTVEALEGRKLAAHVSEVAILSTSNSGVVSYDVTFLLDQMETGLKPGMSATAEVVVKQAEGVNVPTSAISGGAVTVIKNGKQERRRVVTGLAGNSSTIILSGLQAGEKVALPIASSTTSSSSSRIGSALSRGGALGGGLGGGLGGAGGGAAFFRGGGG